MTKEMFIEATEELMEELYPDQEYWELSEDDQNGLDKRALDRVRDKIATLMDEGRERRKYGAG